MRTKSEAVSINVVVKLGYINNEWEEKQNNEIGGQRDTLRALTIV